MVGRSAKFSSADAANGSARRLNSIEAVSLVRGALFSAGPIFPPIEPPVRRSEQADHVDRAESFPFAWRHAEPARAVAPKTGAVFQTSLGPLPDDDDALRCRTIALVRAQGVDAVARQLDEIEKSFDEMVRLAQGTPAAAQIKDQRETFARIARTMRAELSALRASRDAFLPAFRREAIATAKDVIAASRSKVAGAISKYGIDRRDAPIAPERAWSRPKTVTVQDNEATRSLRAAAAEISAAQQKVALLSSGATVDARTLGQKQAELELAERDLAALISRHGRAHPVLLDALRSADPAAKLADFAAGGDRLARALESYGQEALDAADRLEERLERDPDAVWQLVPVVEATKIKLGIEPGALGDCFADQAVRDVRRDRDLQRFGISVIAFTLGIAAALPSGGASIAAWSLAASIADGFLLHDTLENNALHDDARSLDPALSDHTPSRAWTWIEIAGTTVGFAGTICAFAKTPFARLLAREDEIGGVARKISLDLGRKRAAKLLEEVGPERFLQLGRDVPGEALVELLRAHSPATVCFALKELSVFEARALLARFDEPTLAAVRDGMSARALLRAGFDLGADVVAALAPVLRGEGLLRLHAAAGTSLRGKTIHVIEGRIQIGDGFALSPRVFLDLAADVSRSARIEAFAARLPGDVARKISAADLDLDALEQLEKIVELRVAGDHQAANRLLEQCDALSELAAEASKSLRKVQPKKVARQPVRTIPPEAEPIVAHYGDAAAKAFSSKAISAELKASLQGSLAKVADSGRFDQEGVCRVLRQIAGAKNDAQALEYIAQLEHGLRVVAEGRLHAEGQIFFEARHGTHELAPGKRFDFGPQPRGDAIVEDADLLYLGADEKVHVDEVKNTAHALVDKISVKTKGPDGTKTTTFDRKYLRKMESWAAQDPENRVVSIVIHTEKKWTEIARRDVHQLRLIDLLEKHRIPLEISGQQLSLNEWQEISLRLESAAYALRFDQAIGGN